MSSLQILQIRQTPAILGIDADLGQYSIRQPKAELQMNTQPSELTIRQYTPELTIDQSRAFEAYNGGNFLEINKKIYSGIQQLFLQAIASRVEMGNQMAEIHKPGHTIAEIWGSDWKSDPFPEFRGPASMDNVDIHIETRAPDISFRSAESQLNVVVNRPEIEYTRGKLDIYMQQYASIQFIPPEIDVTM
ncbi:DUF6470 family protein [Paenibacillus sp. IHBB 10380]|uniref:DUF6470 family protein n=1 Tax=Paenibacillus sp. IHBB 10380 TaxID=1566358 RepID=UPI000AE375F2|nr:DUF6470 family protein [Paenibacillus sp. IHBB 10380]